MLSWLYYAYIIHQTLTRKGATQSVLGPPPTPEIVNEDNLSGLSIDQSDGGGRSSTEVPPPEVVSR